jgi:hypothetical protein
MCQPMALHCKKYFTIIFHATYGRGNNTFQQFAEFFFAQTGHEWIGKDPRVGVKL